MVFIVALCLLPSSIAGAETFSDVKNYKQEIEYLTDRGILNGYGDGTFKPTNKMNRLNGIQVLLRAKGITNFNAPNPNFTDMSPGTYGYEEVAKAVELGIISGKTNKDGSKYFDPTGQLTRGQMAKIIVESMGYAINDSISFRDVPKSSGYYSYVSTLAVERITEGYTDRTFKPGETVSRQHFATFVARMLNDEFKPKIKPASYLMDTTMVYTQELKENGRTSTTTLSFIGHGKFQNEITDGWKARQDGEEDVFYIWEDRNGLYLGYPESYYFDQLSYPLYKGKVFDDGWGEMKTITSIDRTVETKAGTFYNVLEITDQDGWTMYFAPNVGIIKSADNGRTVMELVKLTPHR